MKRLSRDVFFFYAAIIGLSLIFQSHGIQGQSCTGTHSGWFGSQCQYKCHCFSQHQNSYSCNTDGTCPTSYSCVSGWFGPACQYADLAADSTLSPHYTDRITDGKDDTCNQYSDLTTLTITLKHPYPFTWMRLVFKSSSDVNTVSVYLIRTAENGYISCPKSKNSIVDDKTLDIYCDVHQDVKAVYLSGQGVKALCSVYISGGRNMALKQQNSQSSTLLYGGKTYNSSYAVDGSTTENSCTHTDNSWDYKPKWSLTFTNPRLIYRYVLYNRPGQLDRLRGFQLEAYDETNNIVFSHRDNKNSSLEVYRLTNSNPTTPIKSVNISVVNNYKILTLCEVELYGDCPNGYFGLKCDKCCDQNCGGDGSCHIMSGNCLFGCKLGKCPSGWKGLGCDEPCSPNCGGDGTCHFLPGSCTHCNNGYTGSLCDRACPDGKYGYGCSKSCSTNCNAGLPLCDNISGRCSSGCKDGYKGDLCDQICTSGRFGRGCSDYCSSNCRGGQTYCNHINGTCTYGCNNGYKGNLCNQLCASGTYGLGCSNSCSTHCNSRRGQTSCNHVTGTCTSGCEPGYEGDLCIQKCRQKKYGLNCQDTCSTNCLNQLCDHVTGDCSRGCVAGKRGNQCDQDCGKGFYGSGCSQPCSQNCAGDGTCNPVNGSCDCKEGYTGDKCTDTCPYGKYGPGCSNSCSINCKSSLTLCNHENGKCSSGCKDGYEGDLCIQTCPKGKYGSGCNTNCSQNCKGEESCEAVSGECISGCDAGYQTLLCNEECDHGKYGEKCLYNCSQNCIVNATETPAVCDHISGACLLGCVSRFSGDDCTQALTDSPPPPTTAIVVSLFVVIIVAAALICGIILWRRRRNSKQNESPSTDQPANANMGMSAIRDRNTGASGRAEHMAPGRVGDSAASGQTPTSTTKQSDELYYNTVSVPYKTAIAVSDLDTFLSSQKREFFKEQFERVATDIKADTTVGLSAENRHKNRYKNIITFDHSRVILMANPMKKQGDYINASYIAGYNNEERFIASQGPNQVMLQDFFRMLWEQKVEKVVMLTNLVEEGKVKCDRYWPEESEEEFGEFKVILTTTQVFADYTIRQLQLSKKDSSTTHNFTHFHFTSWPDKGVPTTCWGLVDFEQRVAFYPTSKPIVVHCSAGVGRTGTFIALRNVMREAEDKGYMDFYTTLWKLRQDRMNMIQTLEQYIFLHKAAQASVVCIGTTITAENITHRIKTLNAKTASGETNMEKEFNAICNLCQDNDEEADADAVNNDNSAYGSFKNAINKDKNRFGNILPKNAYRPYLSSGKGQGNYINAVQVPSFMKLRQNILTQLPLPKTIPDFWRLVIQYKVSLIVAFEVDSKETDPTVGDYLPASEDEPVKDLNFDVKSGPVHDTAYWREQTLYIKSHSKVFRKLSKSPASAEEHRVKHIKSETTDLDPGQLLALITQIRANKPLGDTQAIFMCRNGAEWSGLTCVLSLLLDRMHNDNCLTVPLVVGTIKSIRPQVIPTLQQYQALYKVLEIFNDSSSIYSNFNKQNAVSSTDDANQNDGSVYVNTCTPLEGN